jgi:hypothetical protein
MLPEEPISEPSRPFRLWILGCALFLIGFITREVFERNSNVAYSYPQSVAIQFLFYGIGFLIFWIDWILTRKNSPYGVLGCLGLMILAMGSLMAILSSIPK